MLRTCALGPCVHAEKLRRISCSEADDTKEATAGSKRSSLAAAMDESKVFLYHPIKTPPLYKHKGVPACQRYRRWPSDVTAALFFCVCAFSQDDNPLVDGRGGRRRMRGSVGRVERERRSVAKRQPWCVWKENVYFRNQKNLILFRELVTSLVMETNYPQ